MFLLSIDAKYILGIELERSSKRNSKVMHSLIVYPFELEVFYCYVKNFHHEEHLKLEAIMSTFFSCWIFYFQVAIESVLLIQDPKVARQVMFQNPPAKARMVSRGCVVWWKIPYTWNVSGTNHVIGIVLAIYVRRRNVCAVRVKNKMKRSIPVY